MILLMIGLVFGYEPVKGIDFPLKNEVEEFNFNYGVNLKFTVNRQSEENYPDQLLYKAIYSSTVVSLRMVESLGAIYQRCNANETIEIYEVSEEDLNNPARFPEIFENNLKPKDAPVWGYYDPRSKESNLDAIVISPQFDSANYRIVVHEMAHYWYSSFCLDRYTSLSTEEFAVAVQEIARWK